jgi:hypothetical protein
VSGEDKIVGGAMNEPASVQPADGIDSGYLVAALADASSIPYEIYRDAPARAGGS